MRSFNDGPLIGEVLRMVHAQADVGPVQLVHIDSGSKDATVPTIQSFNPHKFFQIQPSDYVPGIVLNRGMRESEGDWVVFLNSDAEPANLHWLSELLKAAHAQPRLGTVFSRQIPRPDCQAVFAHDYDRCFGDQRESANWEHFFSMVSCAVYRPAWLEQPFREDLQYAEDDEWSRRLKANGWGVGFAPTSIAIHSHNYTRQQAYKRAYGDTFAIAAHSNTPPRNYNFRYTVLRGTAVDAIKDWRWCAANGRRREWWHAVTIRFAQRRGKRDGYHAGWVHYKRGPL
jgi:rhamnosyltransferase